MTCARNFNHRVHTMLHTLLKSDTHGVLGTVTDFSLRIEFQQRGTLVISNNSTFNYF